jgi:hypothetical protein
MARKKYSPNARVVLSPYEDAIIEVKARFKEYREHPTRGDLKSAVFVPAVITPFEGGCKIEIHHLWILQRHLVNAGCRLHKGRWVEFLGTVYSYRRLGGKSEERGIKGMWDYGILPIKSELIEAP